MGYSIGRLDRHNLYRSTALNLNPTLADGLAYRALGLGSRI